MRMMMMVRLPNDVFNVAVRDGSAGSKTKAILEATRPEAVYFTETGGQRTVVMIVELEKSSMVPALAEPWFLNFNAAVEFHVVMNPQELEEAGLDKLGERWGQD